VGGVDDEGKMRKEKSEGTNKQKKKTRKKSDFFLSSGIRSQKKMKWTHDSLAVFGPC
jgi:hypothetical protein